MNTPKQLITNCFKHKHAIKPISSVLHLGQRSLDFSEQVYTTRYQTKNCTQLPFTDRSFDFIYAEELSKDKVFRNPFAMINECMRLSQRGGLIQCASPLETIITGTTPRFLMWPDLYTNSLSILPYHKIFIRNRSKWIDLIQFNPIYLSCFYHWDHPLELNIKPVFHGEEMYVEEYTQLVEEAFHQSVRHTQQFIEQFSV
jgi:hypothetical protein